MWIALLNNMVKPAWEFICLALVVIFFSPTAPAREFMLGSRSITIEELNDANGQPSLHIRYNNSAIWSNTANDEVRYRTQHLVPGEEHSQWAVLPDHVELPPSLKADEKKLKTGVLELNISPSNYADWGKLFYLAVDVQAILQNEISTFVSSHKAKFRYATDELAVNPKTKQRNTLENEAYFAMLTEIEGWNRQQSNYLNFNQALKCALATGKFPRRIDWKSYDDTAIDRPALLVTHAMSGFTSPDNVQPILDAYVSKFKKLNQPTVYLGADLADTQNTDWFTSEREPTIAVWSSNGEHALNILTNEITTVGGYFNSCQGRTMKNAVNRYFLKRSEPFTINIPMKASFTIQDERIPKSHTIYARYAHAIRTNTMGDFLKYVEDSLFPIGKDGLRDFGGPPDAEHLGTASERDYTFQVVINGIPTKVIGTGPRKVKLQLWSE